MSDIPAGPSIRLGTATPGGGFPVYGDAFVHAVTAADPTLKIEPRNTKGSTENVPLLESGDLDIALVQGEVVYESLSGIGRPPADLRIIVAMYSTAGMFVVRADSPYRGIRDLLGKPVAFGAKGSGLTILSRYVLDGLGLDQQRDFKAIFLDRAGDGPAMVLDGRAAALWGGGSGWPGFTAVTSSPAGGRFVVPNADEIAAILGRHAFLKRIAVEPNSFPGQSERLESVGSWSFVMARPTLDDETAYRLARALHKSEQLIGERLPQARETSIANTLSAAPSQNLIHSGVMRYAREAGLAR